MKKRGIYVLTCIFLLLVFFDIKLGVPIALEFIYGTPVSIERSVSAGSLENTATPTPFQPVWNTPVPTIAEVVIQPEPSLPENPYDVGNVLFDESDTIEIWFYPVSDDPFPVTFVPIIPVDGPDTYKPGIHKAGVWADDFGNISINPHSGCFKYSKEYIELEGEYLRRFLEGGKCNDVRTNYSDEQMSAQVEELKKAPVVMSQNGNSVNLSVIAGGVIKNENLDSVKSLNPIELAALIGVTLDGSDRSIVIITSGRNLSHNPWYSAERLIIVLQ
ncbi:hypothetical protein A2200_00785 [candidate division WWE3 bacterium RIFOXYA1_FULL_41_11]|nr:MAG: hypothetical protein A2200_00785 [candidate division WWE3 bacterium RIFOXYA1_FULL_41_11]